MLAFAVDALELDMITLSARLTSCAMVAPRIVFAGAQLAGNPIYALCWIVSKALAPEALRVL